MPLSRPSKHSASDGALSPALSLYLDAWRLAAALAVVLCHFGSRRLSGGMLWQLTPYGAEAVDVFFVLSGYVIAYVAATRENSLAQFAVSRVARLWSVALPAAVLTFVLDALGRAISPLAYAGLPGAPERLPILWQAAAGLLFFNRAWGLAIPVGANVPWWSLGYEVPYYVAFALARFGGRGWRLAGPLVVAALSGPSICLMGLLWLAGVAIWRMHRARLPAGGAACIAALLPLPIWVGYEAGCHVFGRPLGLVPGLRPEIVQDFIVGGLFALHLRFAPALLAPLPPCPAVVANVIRFGAMRSFSIYLLHYPVMLFLGAAGPGVTPLWLLPATLSCCLGVAEVTERRTGYWRAVVGRLCGMELGRVDACANSFRPGPPGPAASL